MGNTSTSFVVRVTVVYQAVILALNIQSDIYHLRIVKRS